MPQPCKPKACVDCNKTYTPTSNVQKRCPDCMKNYKPWLAKPAKAAAPHPLGPDVKKSNVSRTALAPSITVNCTMQDTVAIFHALAAAGCSELVFGNTKITIEAV